ncbi:MAG TPA: four helix bundle protein [Blastocatellia bacterium]
MKTKAREFAVRVIRLVQMLPQTKVAELIGSRLLEASLTLGANYRGSYKAKSPTEFIEKMNVVEQQADQCAYWLELLIEADLADKSIIEPLIKEAGEIVSIAVSQISTAKGKRR